MANGKPMRWRRRDLASMDANVDDGLTPVVGTVLSGDEATTSGVTGRNYRVIALVVASALFISSSTARC